MTSTTPPSAAVFLSSRPSRRTNVLLRKRISPHLLLAPVVMTAGIVTLALCLSAATVRAQGGLPFTIDAPPRSELFGLAIASGGDADGDGHDDVFVIDSDWRNDLNEVMGRFYLYSGADGALLWSVPGEFPVTSTLGSSVNGRFIGDVNRDGFDDVAVGTPGHIRDQLIAAGMIEVFSGRDGRLLMRREGTVEAGQLGSDVAGAGDVNNDGFPDVIAVFSSQEDGLVAIFSGRDGTIIHLLEHPWPRRVRWAGDINKDGFADVIVGEWRFFQVESVATVFSGRDGSIIHQFDSPTAGATDFGWSVAGGVDVTGDDVPDLVVSDPIASGPPALFLYSGASGELVRTFPIPDAADPRRIFGLTIWFGNVFGDEKAEIITDDADFIWAFDAETGRIVYRLINEIYTAGFVTGNAMAVGDINADGWIDIIRPALEVVGVTAFGGARLSLDLADDRPRRYQILRGSTADFVAKGLTPGNIARLLGSHSGNACTIIPQLGGICIDLTRPIREVARAIADDTGKAEFAIDVPPDAEPGDLWLQILEVNHSPTIGPAISNVMALVVF